MKLKRTKKGFTIIELVIVIAVIGILAAVLIPTFVNLTNKANEAADNALVNNLNKALKMEEQEPGHQKAPTLEGAIKDLEDQGYILENLASKSGKDLLWSQSENQFLLNTEGKSGKDYWKIVDAVPAQVDQKYSYYAGKNFNQTDVTVKYGFDAGRIDNIGKVTYVGTGTAQEVAIRTNNKFGELNINAIKDEVNHYGEIGDLNIIAVKKGSYGEFGRVGGIATLTYGRLNVKNGGEVTTIVSSPVNATDVELLVEQNAIVSTVISDKQAVLDAFTSSNPNASLDTEKVDDAEAIEEVVNSVAYVLHSGDAKTYYDSFTDAANAATNGETVVVMKDSQYDALINSTLITIGAGKSIILDLNGKVISGVLDNAQSAQVITVKGTLTIKDDTNTGGLNFNTRFASANAWTVAVRVIYVDTTGVLNMQSGNVIAGNAKGTYGIDSRGIVNISGGVLHGGYTPIRVSLGSANITGGKFTGNHGLFMQSGTATISNAKFNCVWEQLYLWHTGGNINVTITNSELPLGGDAIIVFSSYSNDYVSTVTIDGIEIEVPVNQKTTDYNYIG